MLQKRDELMAQSTRLTSLNERILDMRSQLEKSQSEKETRASRPPAQDDPNRRMDDASLSTVSPSVDTASTRRSARPSRPRTVEVLYQTVSETSSLSPSRRRHRAAPKPRQLALRDAPLSEGDGVTPEESSQAALPSHDSGRVCVRRVIPARRRSCDLRHEYGKKLLEREHRRTSRRMSAQQLVSVEPVETPAFLEAGEVYPNLCVDNCAECDLSEVSELSELSEVSYHYQDPFVHDISRTRGSPAEEVERLMEQGQAVHLEPKEFNILNARGFVDDHIFNSLVHKQARKAQLDAEMEALHAKRGGVTSGWRRRSTVGSAATRPRRQSQLGAAPVSPITWTGAI